MICMQRIFAFICLLLYFVIWRKRKVAQFLTKRVHYDIFDENGIVVYIKYITIGGK